MLMIAPALALGLTLSDCSNFDPTDIMDTFAPAKKPLPGDRKELFPGGTPGVSQGLPPELVKGYQAPPPTDASAQPTPDQPKSKAKSKPKVATAPTSPDTQSSGSAAR
jgi:hypothetical protein